MSQPPIGSRSWYPKRLGRFKVVDLIAQGTSGLVLAGKDEDGSKVALKLAEQVGEQARHRFHQEINACRRLNHENIIKIRGSGEFDGRPWYAMDYHGQATLRDLITCNTEGIDNDVPSLVRGIQSQQLRPTSKHRRLLPQTAALNLVFDIGQAVAHAHGRGLIHRDLKPENVLVRDDGRPVVCDFGLVKDLAEASGNTGTGRMLGTIGYQAPEQREPGRTADERVDVYALGVMLDELLTGKTPKVDLFARTAVHRAEEKRRRELDRNLRLIIARATHIDPMRRYHSVQALTSDIERYQRGEPVQAQRDPAWLRLHRWALNHRLAAGSTVIALALLATILIVDLIATRLQEATWTPPLAQLSLTTSEDLSQLEQLQGSWTIDASGARPRLHKRMSYMLAHGETRASAIRVRSLVHIPALDQRTLPSLGLFAANSTGSPDDGYYWELGAFDNSGMVLWRGDRVLWTGTGRLQPGTSYELELEVTDEALIGRIDGKPVFSQVDPAVLTNGNWGVRVDGQHEADVIPVFESLSVRARTVPALQIPSDYPRLMLGLFERSSFDQRLAMWDLVRDACRQYRDSRGSGSEAYDAANLLLLKAYALAQEEFAHATFISTERRQQLVRDIDELLQDSQADTANWLAALDLRWRQQPGERATMLASLRLQVESHPDDREAIRLWMLNKGRAGFAYPFFKEAVAWSGEQTALLDWILANDALRHSAWDPATRLRSEQILLADPVVGPNLRLLAAEQHQWRHQLNDTDETSELLAAEIERFAERQALFHAEDGLGDSAVSTFVRGLNPSARFEYYLAEDEIMLNDWDRHWLGQSINALLPSPYSWGLPLSDDPAVQAELSNFIAGLNDWSGMAELLGERGIAPEDYPWHRLVLCRLIVEPSTAHQNDLVASLPQQGMDLWFSGLVWRWARREPTARSERHGEDLRALVTALQGTAGSQDLEAPRWHPNRPGLDLLLAAHDLRCGDKAAAHRRLELLRRQRSGWPESVAAELLLQKYP